VAEVSAGSSGGRGGWGFAVRSYAAIAALWVRASLAYPTSFALLTVAGFLITGLDFVALWLMFGHLDTLGDFTLMQVALLYGASGVGLRVADLLIGSVERIGLYVRTGRLDQMMTKPVPLLVQICADDFSLRRFGQISQAVIVLAVACTAVEWTPLRVLVGISMVLSSGVIFFGLFVAFSCVQFWTTDASEFANAFTYGGNTMTQYPMTVFPREVVVALTFVVPVAFVNWYPCLYLLGEPDPYGLPSWFAVLSPVVAVLTLAVAAVAWRTGVRHYTSTGS
jgi:viologen exporter family transport system permease protein